MHNKINYLALFYFIKIFLNVAALLSTAIKGRTINSSEIKL